MAPCEGVDSNTMETLRATPEFSSDNNKQRYPSMPHEQSRDNRRDDYESFTKHESQQQHELQNSRKRPLYGQQESQETWNNTKNSGQSKQPRQDFTRDNGLVNDIQHYKEETSDEQGRDMSLLQHQKQLQSPIERRLEVKEQSLEKHQAPVLNHGPPRHMKGYPQQKSRWNNSPSQNGGNGLLHQGRSIKERESQYAHGSSRTMRPPWSGERRPSGPDAPNGSPRWEDNRRNNAESGDRRPSNSSSSFRRDISRRDTNISRRQSVSQSESFSDFSICSGENGSSVEKRVLNFQPGPGVTQQGEFNLENRLVDNGSLSQKKPQSGHFNNRISHPPPARPLCVVLLLLVARLNTNVQEHLVHSLVLKHPRLVSGGNQAI